MTVKEFCSKYNNIVSSKLKESFVKDNLEITTYLPVINKMTLAESLAKISALDHNTGNINLKSDINYLFFCRAIIENYTNLKIETEGFFEEYDEFNKSGIIDKIMAAIPENEVKEFKLLCDMKKNDLIFNMGTPKAYINQQIERVTDIASITLKPVLEKLATEMENMDDTKIDKLVKAIGNVFGKVKQPPKQS